MLKEAQTTLKKIFGYDTFRPLQADVIANILNRKDTLAVMPTGGGKSLCYQIPALIFEGLTVVVTPLISLMKDQVEQLTELAIDAAFLNSTLSRAQYLKTTQRIRDNQLSLLYVAPETLLLPRTLDLLQSIKVDCLAIDEAHCISEWGHDFRPEYRRLVDVRARFPKAVCAAFTATATPLVQKDIKKSLNFASSDQFIASFNRENLFLEIMHKQDAEYQTIHFLKQFPDQSGIVYCTTRKQVDELAEWLSDGGFSVRPYHAGLSDQERRSNQELFIRDDVQIMVATIAFGMGINKPNIRFIVHYDLPQNIESYYQQIGRAGRDGLNAHCLLLFGYGDISKIRYFIDQKGDQEQRNARIHLDAMVAFAESELCRRIPLLNYFGEKYAEQDCRMCDNCQNNNDEVQDVTVAAQKFLSCVKRTGECFGAGHIIDILRGSKSQKIIKFRHDHLPTYNIGPEYSKKEWYYLSRRFIQKGLLKQDQQYGGLSLTDNAWPVLQGDTVVTSRMQKGQKDYKKRAQETDQADHALFDILRKERKAIADKANVPPYVIFSDKTLLEMAIYFPQSTNSMLTIYGVGATKNARYGNTFLRLIQDYCSKNNLDENRKNQFRKPRKGTNRKRRY